MEILKVPSTISSVKTLVDGGLSVNIQTQELTPEDMATLMQLKGKFGWMVFAESGITAQDVPTEKVEFKGDRTQGQRLRGVIYRLWEQDPGGYAEFESFYKAKTEKIIDWLKEKLN